ncbi:MAG: NAD(P)-dependent oxidoreductase [Eubacterium sp.]|nr:NAD(P)-dependent oxidoreductase [Eubacterium sp.]
MLRTTVWIAGASGRVGHALQLALKKNTDYKIIATGPEVDVADLEAVEQAFMIYRPNVIVNCASISNADYCEQNKVEAFRVNAIGARNLAAVSDSNNVKIIHFSTDDVFSGEHNYPKNEFDTPTPKTVYGRSKYAGEKFVRDLNTKHLIVRSSWVYGEGFEDYVSYVLSKAEKGEPFDAAIDRISSPTYIKRIVDFIIKMIPEEEYGIYHVASEGLCTRYQFATTILKLAGYDPGLARASSGAGSNVVSTLLENLMMKITGVYQMPDWHEDLEKYIKGLKKED